MKKLIFALFAASLMLIGTEASAQLSINAGYLNSTTKTHNENPSNANGAFAGLSFNLPIAGSFAIAPGVYYSVISAKEMGSLGTIFSASGKFTEHSINVPLYLNYGIDLARDTNIFIYAGPTAQYGIASTTKLTASIAGVSGSTTENNYDDDDYNRFNVYLGGGLGFEVNNILITVGYDYGMLNLIKGDNAPKSHRSNLKIGVGFAF